MCYLKRTAAFFIIKDRIKALNISDCIPKFILRLKNLVVGILPAEVKLLLELDIFTDRGDTFG